MLRGFTRLPLSGLVFVLAAPCALAQQSASYKLTEDAFNAGGHPAGGAILGSASWRMTLDSVGETVAGTALASSSFRIEGGFTGAYPPPGEVQGVRLLADDRTLEWDPEKSAGVYNLYRDLLSRLSGLGYGACAQHDLAGEAADEPSSPPAADGYFYLVTAENRLREEGTKGRDSAGAERPNASPCP